eukprot:TRINITY_DN13745_c0_g1_i1.p1 TRINITY_DN13745_c0_g1~~TRINITY_DN13745_c0_g1_i1.p1  ORF type:complete len:504 (+),score=157.65 TRINITY_DN13745_c0_g1_i1:49-1512(+)
MEEWFFKLRIVNVLQSHKNSQSYDEISFKIEKWRMLFDQKFAVKFFDFALMFFPLFDDNRENEVASLEVRNVEAKYHINLQNVIHIKKLQIYPILFFFQYLPFEGADRLSENSSEYLSNFLANTLGKLKINTRTPIKLGTLFMEDVIAEKHYFFGSLWEDYKKRAQANFMVLVGSLPFLGVTMSSLNNFGNGVKDFVVTPFTSGPMGVVKGTKSLIQNFSGGVLNSTSGITTTLGNLTALISFDKNYKANRQMQQQEKTKNIGTGFLKAGKSIGKGILGGIMGVIKNPIQGTKEEGAKGLFKGIGKGVGGLLSKPITGLIDATTNIQDGFKGQFHLDEELPNKRFRSPRATTFIQSIKCFNSLECEGQEILQTIKEGKYEKKYSCLYHQPRLELCANSSSKSMILLSDKYIFVLLAKSIDISSILIKKKIKWKKISCISSLQSGIQLDYYGGKHYLIELSSFKEIEILSRKINTFLGIFGCKLFQNL